VKLSVIVTCRWEGLMLPKAVASARQSIAQSGIAEACEILVVADAANGPTLDAAERLEGVRLLRTEFADPGEARNEAARQARGALLLPMDGDDLWGSGWVGAAWRAYGEAGGQTILHPQFCAFFGAREELMVQPDWREPGYDPRGLVARNDWIMSCAVPRAVLLEHPLPRADLPRGFHFEDWSWHRRTTARGLRHRTVPGTVHFIRLKTLGSLTTAAHGCLPVPSREFAEWLAADDPSRPADL
jgi:glycosyltransferase involved in cell wall biosynthesis